MSDQDRPGRAERTTRRSDDASPLDAVLDPETVEESEDYARQLDDRRWEEDRPPHHEAR